MQVLSELSGHQERYRVEMPVTIGVQSVYLYIAGFWCFAVGGRFPDADFEVAAATHAVQELRGSVRER
jgi:hypothetical protein